jgi:phenolic acid decarboxylase
VTNLGTNGFTVNWTACAGATTYQVQVATDTNFTAGGGIAADLFISEYIEGSSNNKAVEIFNGTGSAVDLGAGSYVLRRYDNGSSSVGATITLAGTVTNRGVFVVANPSANAAILAQAQMTSGSMTFNGNDAVALARNSENIDVLGTIGVNVTNLVDVTKVRKSSVSQGTATYAVSEWDNHAMDTASYLGGHAFEGDGAGGTIVADAVVEALTHGVTGLVAETTYQVRVRQTGGEWSALVSATTAAHRAGAAGVYQRRYAGGHGRSGHGVHGDGHGPSRARTGLAKYDSLRRLHFHGRHRRTGLHAAGGRCGRADIHAHGQQHPWRGHAGRQRDGAGGRPGVWSQSRAGGGDGHLGAGLHGIGHRPAGAGAFPACDHGFRRLHFHGRYGRVGLHAAANDVGAQSFTFAASNVAGVAWQTVSVTVASAPVYIPEVNVTNIGTNVFTVLWTEVTDATTYQVQVATDTNFTGSTGGTNFLSQNFTTLTTTTPPTGWTSSTSSDLVFTEPYAGAASPAYKFSVNGQWLLSPVFAAGGTNLQFWALGRNVSGSTYTISGLVAGVWTRVATVSVARTEATYNVPLDPQTTQIKFTFTRIVNCSLDDIVIQGAAAGSVIVDETVAALSYGATGLDPETDYFVRVRATDGTWSAVAAATTLGNDPVMPWFTGGTGPHATTAGVAVAFTVSAMGVPEPVLALAGATAAGGSYSFIPAIGYFLYLPPVGDAGAQTFTFTASNSAGVATQVVAVAVSAAVAPVFTPLGTQSATTLVANVFYVEASGEPEPVLALAGTSASAEYSFSPDTGRLSYTPPTNDVGPQTFTFTASNIAGVATQVVDMVVSNAPAAPPVIDPIPPQATMVGLMFSYTVTATDPDTPTSNLTFACTSAVDTNRWELDPATGYFLFEPTTNQIGTNVFTFTATDSPTLLSSPPSNMVVVVNAAGRCGPGLLRAGPVSWRRKGRGAWPFR